MKDTLSHFSARLFKYLKSMLGETNKRVKSYTAANDRTDVCGEGEKRKNDRQMGKYRVKHIMLRTWIASLISTLSKKLDILPVIYSFVFKRFNAIFACIHFSIV